ncbi:MAG: hydroxyisourate hydrolase [Methylobacteriaceae bacterium]|nr:hydroxyisourate hydrolase [Methylobacteriaceae bacterium]
MAPGRLTTHVLDTAGGRPAEGVLIELFAAGPTPRLIRTARTNADGRCDAPLLAGDELQSGRYELRFHVADYFRGRGVALPEPPFLDVVPIAFGVGDAGAHYHVPLLIAPYAFSTYRGS